MSTRHRSTWRWLAILVLAHLVVSIVHGMAHVDANVPLTLAQSLSSSSSFSQAPWSVSR
jgi:hypothetical protein